MNNNEQIAGTGVDPVVYESLNHISSRYAALFWEGIYFACWSISTLKDIHMVFLALCENRYHDEAFSLLRSYSEILSLDWEAELEVIDQIHELKEHFMDEFILDTEEIIIDLLSDNE